DNPYARIIVEVAVLENTSVLEHKMRNLPLKSSFFCIRQSYDSSSSTAGRKHTINNPNLAAISVLEDFGILQLGSEEPTSCTGPDIANYTVTVPVSDVFWDPPIDVATTNCFEKQDEAPTHGIQIMKNAGITGHVMLND
ncbi:4327_t:CDS:2, partial [Paraglomus occultum]